MTCRATISRRDRQESGDWFALIVDPFHDHLSRVRFQVNPSGVKSDALGPGGTNPDAGWDPVWEVATAIDSLGWTAELRIPFSQLRYPRDSVQTWGLQAQRYEQRLNELSFFDNTEDPETAGFRRILVTESSHPYVGAWWPPGHLIGYEHGFTHQARDFVVAVATDSDPDLHDREDVIRFVLVGAIVAELPGAGRGVVEALDDDAVAWPGPGFELPDHVAARRHAPDADLLVLFAVPEKGDGDQRANAGENIE